MIQGFVLLNNISISLQRHIIFGVTLYNEKQDNLTCNDR